MSTERQRDAETDRLLRATLQPGVHAEACPGPDMLAAYAEGALAPAERDGLEGHFSECHRCQEALALMARAWTAPDAAQPSSSGRWWHLRSRWLVPAAAAAVIVLYAAVRPVIAPYFPPGPQSSAEAPTRAPEHVMADARPQERGAITAEPAAGGAAEIALSKTPEAKGTGRSRATGAQFSDIKGIDRLAAPSKPESAAASREKEAGERPQEAGRADQNTQLRAADSRVTVVAGRAETPLPAEAAKSRAAVANEPQAGALPPGAFAQAPATPPATAPPAPRAAAADAPLQQLAVKTAAAAPRYVTSPDGSVVWRIAPGGLVARSVDGGSTWLAQPPGVSRELLAGSAGRSKELLAGSAPSAAVCWIVGREATIIVTTDGAHWTTRPFPERVDLVAVEATDASSATVTTRDGRRFATQDGGATWSARRD